MNWVSIEEPVRAIRAQVKIRHKHDPAPATVVALPHGRARITFDRPQRAVTPGQAAVLYSSGVVAGGPPSLDESGTVVLAGGWIR